MPTKAPSKSDLVPDLAGVVVDNGRLKLERKLGNGAYGVTYCARNLTEDGPPFVAVKCILRAGLATHQLAQQRKEINNHYRVSSHRNVVSLYRTFEERGLLFMVMELASAGDMFAAITETYIYLGRDNLIKHVFLGLVDAVIHCHSLGVAHRDLKPENILVMDDGLRLVIADFGLATTEPTCHEWGCGSSFYMSPECHGLDRRAKYYASQPNDVWALGVILINLTTGRNPWKHATPKDQTFKAFMEDPDFLRSILPLSRSANDVLKRCFALDPKQRITAGELRREVLAVDRFTMNKAELLRSPSAVRAAAKAAWGEMEKARAKQATPTVLIPFPDFPYDSETELIRHARPQLIVNVRQPSDASHDSAAGPSMSSTRGIFQRNSDSLTVFDDNSRRPSLFSGSSNESGSGLHTPQFSPHRSLEDVPGFNLDCVASDPKSNGDIFPSPRRPKEKIQPTPEKEPKPPSSPIVSMGRFFKRIKL